MLSYWKNLRNNCKENPPRSRNFRKQISEYNLPFIINEYLLNVTMITSNVANIYNSLYTKNAKSIYSYNSLINLVESSINLSNCSLFKSPVISPIRFTSNFLPPKDPPSTTLN